MQVYLKRGYRSPRPCYTTYPTNQDCYYTISQIQWSVREREPAMGLTLRCVFFMRGGLECDSGHVSVEGQCKADVCELGSVCMLSHCH